MECKNCGTKLPKNAKFCYNCGASTQGSDAADNGESIEEKNPSSPQTPAADGPGSAAPQQANAGHGAAPDRAAPKQKRTERESRRITENIEQGSGSMQDTDDDLRREAADATAAYVADIEARLDALPDESAPVLTDAVSIAHSINDDSLDEDLVDAELDDAAIIELEQIEAEDSDAQSTAGADVAEMPAPRSAQSGSTKQQASGSGAYGAPSDTPYSKTDASENESGRPRRRRGRKSRKRRKKATGSDTSVQTAGLNAAGAAETAGNAAEAEGQTAMTAEATPKASVDARDTAELMDVTAAAETSDTPSDVTDQIPEAALEPRVLEEIESFVEADDDGGQTAGPSSEVTSEIHVDTDVLSEPPRESDSETVEILDDDVHAEELLEVPAAQTAEIFVDAESSVDTPVVAEVEASDDLTVVDELLETPETTVVETSDVFVDAVDTEHPEASAATAAEGDNVPPEISAAEAAEILLEAEEEGMLPDAPAAKAAEVFEQAVDEGVLPDAPAVEAAEVFEQAVDEGILPDAPAAEAAEVFAQAVDEGVLPDAPAAEAAEVFEQAVDEGVLPGAPAAEAAEVFEQAVGKGVLPDTSAAEAAEVFAQAADDGVLAGAPAAEAAEVFLETSVDGSLPSVAQDTLGNSLSAAEAAEVFAEAEAATAPLEASADDDSENHSEADRPADVLSSKVVSGELPDYREESEELTGLAAAADSVPPESSAPDNSTLDDVPAADSAESPSDLTASGESALQSVADTSGEPGTLAVDTAPAEMSVEETSSATDLPLDDASVISERIEVDVDAPLTTPAEGLVSEELSSPGSSGPVEAASSGSEELLLGSEPDTSASASDETSIHSIETTETRSDDLADTLTAYAENTPSVLSEPDVPHSSIELVENEAAVSESSAEQNDAEIISAEVHLAENSADGLPAPEVEETVIYDGLDSQPGAADEDSSEEVAAELESYAEEMPPVLPVSDEAGEDGELPPPVMEETLIYDGLDTDNAEIMDEAEASDAQIEEALDFLLAEAEEMPDVRDDAGTTEEAGSAASETVDLTQQTADTLEDRTAEEAAAAKSTEQAVAAAEDVAADAFENLPSSDVSGITAAQSDDALLDEALDFLMEQAEEMPDVSESSGISTEAEAAGLVSSALVEDAEPAADAAAETPDVELRLDEDVSAAAGSNAASDSADISGPSEDIQLEEETVSADTPDALAETEGTAQDSALGAADLAELAAETPASPELEAAAAMTDETAQEESSSIEVESSVAKETELPATATAEEESAVMETAAAVPEQTESEDFLADTTDVDTAKAPVSESLDVVSEKLDVELPEVLDVTEDMAAATEPEEVLLESSESSVPSDESLTADAAITAPEGELPSSALEDAPAESESAEVDVLELPEETVISSDESEPPSNIPDVDVEAASLDTAAVVPELSAAEPQDLPAEESELAASALALEEETTSDAAQTEESALPKSPDAEEPLDLAVEESELPAPEITEDIAAPMEAESAAIETVAASSEQSEPDPPAEPDTVDAEAASPVKSSAPEPTPEGLDIDLADTLFTEKEPGISEDLSVAVGSEELAEPDTVDTQAASPVESTPPGPALEGLDIDLADTLLAEKEPGVSEDLAIAAGNEELAEPDTVDTEAASPVESMPPESTLEGLDIDLADTLLAEKESGVSEDLSTATGSEELAEPDIVDTEAVSPVESTPPEPTSEGLDIDLTDTLFAEKAPGISEDLSIAASSEELAEQPGVPVEDAEAGGTLHADAPSDISLTQNITVTTSEANTSEDVLEAQTVAEPEEAAAASEQPQSVVAEDASEPASVTEAAEPAAPTESIDETVSVEDVGLEEPSPSEISNGAPEPASVTTEVPIASSEEPTEPESDITVAEELPAVATSEEDTAASAALDDADATEPLVLETAEDAAQALLTEQQDAGKTTALAPQTDAVEQVSAPVELLPADEESQEVSIEEPAETPLAEDEIQLEAPAHITVEDAETPTAAVESVQAGVDTVSPEDVSAEGTDEESAAVLMEPEITSAEPADTSEESGLILPAAVETIDSVEPVDVSAPADEAEPDNIRLQKNVDLHVIAPADASEVSGIIPPAAAETVDSVESMDVSVPADEAEPDNIRLQKNVDLHVTAPADTSEVSGIIPPAAAGTVDSMESMDVSAPADEAEPDNIRLQKNVDLHVTAPADASEVSGIIPPALDAAVASAPEIIVPSVAEAAPEEIPEAVQAEEESAEALIASDNVAEALADKAAAQIPTEPEILAPQASEETVEAIESSPATEDAAEVEGIAASAPEAPPTEADASPPESAEVPPEAMAPEEDAVSTAPSEPDMAPSELAAAANAPVDENPEVPTPEAEEPAALAADSAEIAGAGASPPDVSPPDTSVQLEENINVTAGAPPGSEAPQAAEPAEDAAAAPPPAETADESAPPGTNVELEKNINVTVDTSLESESPQAAEPVADAAAAPPPAETADESAAPGTNVELEKNINVTVDAPLESESPQAAEPAADAGATAPSAETADESAAPGANVELEKNINVTVDAPPESEAPETSEPALDVGAQESVAAAAETEAPGTSVELEETINVTAEDAQPNTTAESERLAEVEAEHNLEETIHDAAETAKHVPGEAAAEMGIAAGAAAAALGIATEANMAEENTRTDEQTQSEAEASAQEPEAAAEQTAEAEPAPETEQPAAEMESAQSGEVNAEAAEPSEAIDVQESSESDEEPAKKRKKREKKERTPRERRSFAETGQGFLDTLRNLPVKWILLICGIILVGAGGLAAYGMSGASESAVANAATAALAGNGTSAMASVTSAKTALYAGIPIFVGSLIAFLRALMLFFEERSAAKPAPEAAADAAEAEASEAPAPEAAVEDGSGGGDNAGDGGGDGSGGDGGGNEPPAPEPPHQRPRFWTMPVILLVAVCGVAAVALPMIVHYRTSTALEGYWAVDVPKTASARDRFVLMDNAPRAIQLGEAPERLSKAYYEFDGAVDVRDYRLEEPNGYSYDWYLLYPYTEGDVSAPAAAVMPASMNGMEMKIPSADEEVDAQFKRMSSAEWHEFYVAQEAPLPEATFDLTTPAPADDAGLEAPAGYSFIPYTFSPEGAEAPAMTEPPELTPPPDAALPLQPGQGVDVTGDGSPDELSVASDGQTVTLTLNGNGIPLAFAPAPDVPYQVYAVDVDPNDGMQEIIVQGLHDGYSSARVYRYIDGQLRTVTASYAVPFGVLMEGGQPEDVSNILFDDKSYLLVPGDGSIEFPVGNQGGALRMVFTDRLRLEQQDAAAGGEPAAEEQSAAPAEPAVPAPDPVADELPPA